MHRARLGRCECCLEWERRWLGVCWHRASRPSRPSKGHRGELGCQLLVAAQNVVLIPDARRGGRMAVAMPEIPQRSTGLRGHRRRRVTQIMPAQVPYPAASRAGRYHRYSVEGASCSPESRPQTRRASRSVPVWFFTAPLPGLCDRSGGHRAPAGCWSTSSHEEGRCRPSCAVEGSDSI